jgi:hypothetical protein
LPLLSKSLARFIKRQTDFPRSLSIESLIKRIELDERTHIALSIGRQPTTNQKDSLSTVNKDLKAATEMDRSTHLSCLQEYLKYRRVQTRTRQAPAILSTVTLGTALAAPQARG